MGSVKKLLALLLCAMLLLSLVFSISFISHEAGHDCAGEECQICAVISECTKVIERILAVATVFVLCGAPLLFVRHESDFVAFLAEENSPVKLKVKLSN